MNIGDLVLYKNNQLIALNKPVALPVQNDKTGDKTLLDLAEIYTHSKLQLIHRLDRPASGVVLFAKNKKALAYLNLQFQERRIKKTYLAVVKNLPEKKEGTLVHFLVKNQKKNISFASVEEKPNSKKADMVLEEVTKTDRFICMHGN